MGIDNLQRLAGLKRSWDEPADLLRQDKEKAAPFPRDFLPGPLNTFAADTATRMQCPVDLIGIPLIIGAGAMIGKEFGMG
jgi:hypothetical protein